MKRLALIVAVLLLPALAVAGGPTTPDFQRLWQGYRKGGAVRTCTSTASTLVNGVGDRIMWTARLEPGGTTTVWICCDAQYTEAAAPTPTPIACTAAAATIAIDTSLPAYKEGDAARPRCQCITSSGSQAVRVTESR